jgi:cytochrome c oxidase cbb3-type subunit 3
MMAFWASVAFWIGYSVIYPMWPGISSHTKGVTGWTAIGEYKAAMAEVEAVRKPFEDKISSMSAKEILADKELTSYVVAAGKVLFGDNCAACHASGGSGNPGFPVLADDDWLYGGSVETIEQTITNGRKGNMPSHKGVLSDAEIDTLANYVAGLSEGKKDAAGAKMFQEKACFACHGMDAKGNVMLGSANLTDGIWRFTPGGVESARLTITHGVNAANDPMTRNAEMPAFAGRLSKDSIKKLAVYVHNFGGGQ